MRPTTGVVNVDELLRIAGPSIKYRTRREVLGESLRAEGMAELQAGILGDPLVRRVFSSRCSDGWLGKTFHGADGIEACIRILCEKGLARDHPVLAQALDVLAGGDSRLHLGIGKVGRAADDAGVGGQEMIRAAVFAYAGDEGRSCVQTQIAEALRGFRAILDVESIDEIAEPYKGKLVFREGVCWPSIYHLRLLAGTHGWRSEKSLRMVSKAVEGLIDLSPIPQICLRRGSQLMAPASFAMDDFATDLEDQVGYGQLLWFHRMELLARLGVIGAVPSLQRMVDRLVGMLEDGLFTRRLSHSSFRNWGVYAGLALERDWRAAVRRAADLTFRCLLILHYASVEPA